MNCLDLFSGAAGGWSLGLSRAGFTTVAACEIDPWRRAVFAHNNPGVLMYGDIRELTGERLASDGIHLQVICGSPPCQDASTANTRGKGVDGSRTGLFFEALRLVREVRPSWVLLENVPGLRVRGYDRVAEQLENAGYAVRPFVVGAVHAGAPHLRRRVWIVANLPGERCGPGRSRRLDSSDARELEQAFQADAFADAGEPIASKWQDWNGGAPLLSRVDDGLQATLDSRRGIGRACIAAYGDSVAPKITKVIGRAILALEASR